MGKLIRSSLAGVLREEPFVASNFSPLRQRPSKDKTASSKRFVFQKPSWTRSILPILNLRHFKKGALEKGIFRKMSKTDFQMCNKFATILRTLCEMYKMKCQQFCANLASNLRQLFLTPPSRTPPSRNFLRIPFVVPPLAF